MNKLIKSNFHIKYKSNHNSPRFLVTNPDTGRVTIFRMSPTGLFYHDTADTTSSHVLINTARENKYEYTNKQVKDARGMATVQNIIGASDSHLRHIIETHAIPNMPYTTSDLHNKTNIYGPNLSHLKSKTVWIQPSGVPTRTISLPHDYIL
mmetsp:Transcript_22639/g.31950  ORF Transcript_22639/g.31950 Transcript_22639/m.31950 type:complete len:151 (-) Transcript_22639:48-500(-)